VQAAAYARQLPLVQLEDAITLTTRHNGVDTVLGDAPDIRFVSRDYLATIGTRLVAGRHFAETDGEGRPGVVIINDAFARREFARENPLGQFVYFGPQRQMPLEIIGVVSDVRQFGLDREPEPQYFMDMRQIRTDPAFRAPPLFPFGAYYAVRTRADRAALVAAIRAAVRQLDDRATLDNVATMDEIVANSLTRPWMYTVLLGMFAAVALSLACIGLYGVITYTVAQRTREIGIRIALGAGRRRVLRLVLRQSSALTAAGLVLGLAGAAIVTRSLTGLLFGLTPLDPATYAAAALVLAVVASLASVVPAHHATEVDPMVALRTE
jgi:putative ABC transport system permease protein